MIETGLFQQPQVRGGKGECVSASGSLSKLEVALPRETGELEGMLGGVCMLHRIIHSTYTLHQKGHLRQES